MTKFEELIEAVKANNLELVKNLIETKDGNLLIEHSSWLEIELLEIAKKNKFTSLVKYLTQFAHYYTL